MVFVLFPGNPDLQGHAQRALATGSKGAVPTVSSGVSSKAKWSRSLSWVGKGKLGFEAGAPQTKQVRTQFDAGCWLLVPHDSDVGASMLWALSLHLISCELNATLHSSYCD